MRKLRPPKLFTQAKKYPAENGGIFFIKKETSFQISETKTSTAC